MEILQSRIVGRRIFDIQPSQRVSRKLFGDVDHDEMKRDLAKDYKNILKQKCLLWNFDFEKGLPQNNKASSLTWLPLKVDYESLKHDKKLFIASSQNNKTTDLNQISTKKDSSTNSQANGILPTSEESKSSTTENLKERIEAMFSGDSLSQYKNQGNNDIKPVKIINESPLRPTYKSPDIEITKVVKQSIKCNTVPNYKRKRYQQKIDDFMRKRKRRISFDALEISSCKMSNKDSLPVATRLRSSQVSV